MRHAVPGVLLFLTVAVLSCRPATDEPAQTARPDSARQDPAADSSAPGSDPSLPDSTYRERIASIMSTGRSFGSSLETLRNNLGEPAEVVRVDTTNRHTGEPDTVLYVRYEGLEVELYRVGASGRELLSSATMTGNAHAAALPFRIGAAREEILGYLGQPFETEQLEGGATKLVYETVDEPTVSSLILWLENGRLQRLKWAYYLD